MYSSNDEANDIIALFQQAFESIKKEKILLYGLGINTKAIIQNIHDFNIVGVMDAKHEGEYFCGKYIYSEEDAPKVAKIIIIIARETFVPIIYQRIKHLETVGAKIYNVSGENLKEKGEKTRELPFQMNKSEIEQAIIEHDVICFDIFDTLVIRKVVQPTDIFEIVHERLANRNIHISFSQIRKKAEKKARKLKKSPKLNEIYHEMRLMKHFSEAETATIMEEELDTEIKFSTPRISVVELLDFAKRNGKKVFLVSDMYLDALQLTRLLDHLNIKGYDKIIVSCEYGKNKWPEGELFEVVKNNSPTDSKILHIGDNDGADILCAKKRGLDAIKIISIYETLVNSELYGLLSYNRTIGDSLSIGSFAATYLSNPFEFIHNKGIIYLQSPEEVGRVGFGTLVVGFLTWIKHQCEVKEIRNIGFLARDGWILDKAWQLMIEYFPTKNNLNETYILGSRKVLAITSLYDSNDIEKALLRVPPQMNVCDMMSSRFGIDKEQTGCEKEKKECVKKFEKEILQNAEAQRNIYNKYINSQFIENEKVAIVDAVSSGTLGGSFYRTIGKEGYFLCLVKSMIPNYSIFDEIDAMGFLGEDNKYMPKFAIHKHVDKLESVVTSPNPMFLGFDNNGNEKYAAPEMSQINGELLQMVHKGILDFASEFYEKAESERMLRLTPELCDMFFGLIYELKICVATEVTSRLGVRNDF